MSGPEPLPARSLARGHPVRWPLASQGGLFPPAQGAFFNLAQARKPRKQAAPSFRASPTSPPSSPPSGRASWQLPLGSHLGAAPGRQQPPGGLRLRAAGSASRPRPSRPRVQAGPRSLTPHASVPPPGQIPCSSLPPHRGSPSPRRAVEATPPQSGPLPASPVRVLPARLARPRSFPSPRARRPLSPRPPPLPRSGSPQPGPRLQILPRRLCSTRTSRLSSFPASGSAVAVAAGASEEAAAAAGAAAAVAAMVPPGPCRSPAACVAGEAEPSGGLGWGRREPGPAPAPRPGSPRPHPTRAPRAAPPPRTREAEADRAPDSFLFFAALGAQALAMWSFRCGSEQP